MTRPIFVSVTYDKYRKIFDARAQSYLTDQYEISYSASIHLLNVIIWILRVIEYEMRFNKYFIGRSRKKIRRKMSKLKQKSDDYAKLANIVGSPAFDPDYFSYNCDYILYKICKEILRRRDGDVTHELMAKVCKKVVLKKTWFCPYKNLYDDWVKHERGFGLKNDTIFIQKWTVLNPHNV
uniref:Uncharacterized protein n=1 Tax=Abalone asfa-like virus TaxID=2839893 RepID=A0A5K7XZ85_9VIRU|nr:hypothetical protein [Abalone asfa-like virus]BCY04567.1 hypothetical protein [Abalone asfa-like virus]